MEKIKQLIIKMNEYGIPLPMLRIDGKPSISATMMFLAFNTALLGQIGKLAGILGGIDLTQANYLFGISASLYFGRKITASKNDITVSSKQENE